MNLSHLQWQQVLSLIRRCYPGARLAFHGLREETYEFPVEGAEYATDITNSIAILNTSRVLITSMSGFAQFAANCGCPVLQIGPASKWFAYSPFGQPCRQLSPERLHLLNEELGRFPARAS
jgi:hypothetical protein